MNVRTAILPLNDLGQTQVTFQVDDAEPVTLDIPFIQGEPSLRELTKAEEFGSVLELEAFFSDSLYESQPMLDLAMYIAVTCDSEGKLNMPAEVSAD